MIRTERLNHFYGRNHVVKDVSFSIDKGEIVCLLGPNGAGKTTILKILSTQIAPSSGRAYINGIDTMKDPVGAKRFIGYLPEIPPLYDVLEVREYLRFVGRAKGLSGSNLKERLEWVNEFIGLSAVWTKPIGELSRGYRQRVGLAQAIISDPPVIILDEPTTGLDPLQTIEVRQLIKDLSKNKAILFSTHILQEPSALADRILILNEGRLIAEGSMEELAEKSGIKELDMEKIFIHFIKKDAERHG